MRGQRSSFSTVAKSPFYPARWILVSPSDPNAVDSSQIDYRPMNVPTKTLPARVRMGTQKTKHSRLPRIVLVIISLNYQQNSLIWLSQTSHLLFSLRCDCLRKTGSLRHNSTGDCRFSAVLCSLTPRHRVRIGG